jgi:hypothetical protein
MAFIRSERNAFSRLFPDARMPDADVIDDNIIDVPGSGKVNTGTGEIVQGEIVSEKTIEPSPVSPPAPSEGIAEVAATESLIDLDWLRDSLKKIGWPEISKYLKDKYGVTGKTVSEMVTKLNRSQATEFTNEVEERLKMKGG